MNGFQCKCALNFFDVSRGTLFSYKGAFFNVNLTFFVRGQLWMFFIENTLEVRYANNFSSLSVSQSLLLRTRTQVKPCRFFFWELIHENGRWCAKKCFAYQPEIVQLALWQVHDQVVARITYLLELAVLTRRCYFELTSFYIFGIKIHVILFDSCVFFPVFSVLFIMVARTISQLVWLCRGNVMFFLKAEIKIVKASLLLWNKIAHKGIPP